MSWMSDLIKTYEACESAAGLGDADKALLPVGHTLFTSDICITLNGRGEFIKADSIEGKDKKTIAPCTLKSETARTGGCCPHVLFEQLMYLADGYSKDNGFLNGYIQGLESWSSGNQKLESVLAYIKNGSILNDLGNNSEKLKLKLQDGKIDGKLGIRFAVEIPGNNTPKLWQDKELQKRWTIFCTSQMNNEKTIDYITGDFSSYIVDKHPKDINPARYHSKLISSKDENFRWHGRFTDASQVLSVSYESSQKAHQTLRWLLKNIAYRCDSQSIIAWSVGKVKEDSTPFEAEYDPFSPQLYIENGLTQNELLANASSLINYSFSEKIRNALSSMGRIHKVHVTSIDIMAIDAATEKGSMSVTFFETLPEDTYLEMVEKWHTTCSWFIPYPEKDETGITHEKTFVGAPSISDIISAVHGSDPKKGSENYYKIAKYERNRLLHCVFRGARLPIDMLLPTINNASKPLSFRDDKSSWNQKKWRNVLACACALTNKYQFDYKKELYQMALDRTNNDRSYLWGRLLAVAERIELYARYKKGVTKSEERPTNALNYMTEFSAHPLTTWVTITKQIKPYKQSLNGAEWFQHEIDEIMNLFEPDDYMKNSPLDGKYLMGYSLERLALQSKTKITEENKNESTEEN